MAWTPARRIRGNSCRGDEGIGLGMLAARSGTCSSTLGPHSVVFSKSVFDFPSRRLKFLSGFKQHSSFEDLPPCAGRSGARGSSPPCAGAGGDALANHCPPCAGRSRDRALPPPSAGVGDVLGDRCSPCAGRSREKARAQKWCIDSGAGDVRRVIDAKGDASESEQDEAIVVVSRARPPRAGVGSLSGTKIGRTVSLFIRLVRHLVHVFRTLMSCLLLLLVHLLPPLLHVALHLHLLLLGCASA